jgi:hypothetical protein
VPLRGSQHFEKGSGHENNSAGGDGFYFKEMVSRQPQTIFVETPDPFPKCWHGNTGILECDGLHLRRVFNLFGLVARCLQRTNCRVGRLHLPTRMWRCIRGHAALCPPYASISAASKTNSKAGGPRESRRATQKRQGYSARTVWRGRHVARITH